MFFHGKPTVIAVTLKEITIWCVADPCALSNVPIRETNVKWPDFFKENKKLIAQSIYLIFLLFRKARQVLWHSFFLQSFDFRLFFYPTYFFLQYRLYLFRAILWHIT
jgi:hypothetical protein